MNQMFRVLLGQRSRSGVESATRLADDGARNVDGVGLRAQPGRTQECVTLDTNNISFPACTVTSVAAGARRALEANGQRTSMHESVR
jgi:hypothetical protein